MKRILLILILIIPLYTIAQTRIGLKRFVVAGVVPPPPVPPDTTIFENIVVNPIIDLYYKPNNTNFNLGTITQDVFLNVINTVNGNTGLIRITLATGAEAVYVNGISSFTKPTSPVTFTIHYFKTGGTLTFN